MNAPSGAVPGARPVQLLVTCTANRVRSPFAEAAIRRHADQLGLPIEVRSAGLLAGDLPAIAEMVAAANRFGLDLTHHRSTTVDPERLAWADLVVTMTGQHVLDLAGISPECRPRTITLKEWASACAQGRPITDWNPDLVRAWAAVVADRPLDRLLSGELDVADPIGRPKRFYRRAAQEIDELVRTCFASADGTAPG